MTRSEKETFIRRKAKAHAPGISEHIFWSLHAIGKLVTEKLRKDDVERSLKRCIIIEDYEMTGRPLPGCLVLGFTGARPLHAVIALDDANDRIFVITAYKPSAGRWSNGWKKRK